MLNAERCLSWDAFGSRLTSIWKGSQLCTAFADFTQPLQTGILSSEAQGFLAGNIPPTPAQTNLYPEGIITPV